MIIAMNKGNFSMKKLMNGMILLFFVFDIKSLPISIITILCS